MPLVPPQSFRKTEFIHRRGLASARPNFADVLPGTLYFSTDTFVLERSTGAVWESYGNNIYTVISPTATGTQNDWAPGIFGNTTIFWNGASALTVTGFAAGVLGQIIIFKNITTAQIATFSHNSGSSVAANRLQNLVISAGTPVAAGGYIVYQHNGTDWKLVGHEQGAWITPTFAAGDYTGTGSMVWTVDSGDIETQKYRLSGKTLTVTFSISTSTTSGTASNEVRIGNGAWGSFTVDGTVYGAGAQVADGTNNTTGIATVVTTILAISHTAFINFALATNLVYIRALISFPVT